ncbi:MAG TPA: hypothetical protein VH253_03980 [Phycisphaerae bacterium]|nr:hypothetical protein [Phycisphaerae bacterium]
MPKFVIESLADNAVTLRVPGMNYQNTFAFHPNSSGVENLQPGHRIRGTIHAPAWKVDRVDMGGNYVEPLFGRPRRMQGTILSVNAAANELTVQVGYEVTVRLPEKYRAADYQPGQRVGWDNIDIPTFEPAPASTTPIAPITPAANIAANTTAPA